VNVDYRIDNEVVAPKWGWTY